MAGTRGGRCCSEKPGVVFDIRSNLLLVNINAATYTRLSVVKNTFEHLMEHHANAAGE